VNGDGVSGKAKRAAAVAGGAVASELLGQALTGTHTADAGTPPPPAEAHATPETGGHDWVPESETTTVTHGADGSVGATTGTVWQPEGAKPGEDVPTIEEFEQIEVKEDAFGNFIIDASERVVVHNHGHDEVYEDHQHVVIAGDGTPGDTDLDIVEREHVVVHENADGTISVEHSESLSIETHADAPGHGDVEVWQEEGVTLDDAPTGPPGINVGITEGEQAHIDDPFGEATGDTAHQQESVGDKSRTGSTTTTVPAPGPVYRQPSIMDTPRPVVDNSELAAGTSLAAKEPAPAPKVEHHPAFSAHPAPTHHDPAELAGPKSVQPEQHHTDSPETQPHHTEVPAATTDEKPVIDQPDATEPPQHEQTDTAHDQFEPQPALETPHHDHLDQVHG
jgi:hypothetical protein